MSGYLCLASLPSGSSFWTTQTAEGSRGDRPPLGGAELAPFGFRGLLEQERARPQEGCKPDGESGCLIHEALEGWHFISQGQVSQELMDSGRTRGYLAPQPGTIPWGLEVPADADQVKRLPAGCSVVGWREQQS